MGRVESASRRPARDAVLLGTAATVLALIAAQRRQLWGDEAATISATNRPLGELWQMLHHVDAVHGAYYLFMHFWVAAFGTSATSLRFPSAIAVGSACAGVVLLGQRLGGRGTGLVAGAVFATMPRVMWAGSEGRQYGLTAMLAVALVWAALNAWDRGRLRDWAVYAAVAALGILTFLFFGFLVAAITGAAVLLRRRPLATFAASAAAGAVLAPFAVFTATQTAQVAWVENPTSPLQTLGVDQFFSGAEETMGWVVPWMRLLACVVLLLVLMAVADAVRNVENRDRVVLTLLLVLLPLIGILAMGLVGHNSYVARYLTFTTPFLALLVAFGVTRLATLAPRSIAAAGLAVVVALGIAPGMWAATSQPCVTNDQEIAVMVAHRNWPAAVVFAMPSSRNRKLLYPDAFKGMRDIALQKTPTQADNLWGTSRRIPKASFAGLRQVWYFGPQVVEWNLTGLIDAGCRVVHVWKFGDDNSVRRLNCMRVQS